MRVSSNTEMSGTMRISESAHAFPGLGHGAYRGLFERPSQTVSIVDDASGNRTLEKTPLTEKLFDFSSKEQISLTPNADSLLFVPMAARGKTPIILTPQDEYKGSTVKIAAETQDLQALTAYVRLGMNRGKWRDLFEPQRSR